jgi:hypothetical protein
VRYDLGTRAPVVTTAPDELASSTRARISKQYSRHHHSCRD